MALTAEQQAEIQLEVDKQVYRLNAEAAADVYAKEQVRETVRETLRRDYEASVEARRARLEAIRLAKETLIENDRSKPADERGVSSDDIVAFATALNTYVNQ